MDIWDALHDLVAFVQFKKHEIHPRISVTFSKVETCKYHVCLLCTHIYTSGIYCSGHIALVTKKIFVKDSVLLVFSGISI